MKAFTIGVLLAGFALFGWLLFQADLPGVAHAVEGLGWLGALAILAVFALAFQADVLAWHLTFRSLRLSWFWELRLWLVNMVGEALNIVAPFGSLGGEPFKALLLNRHYGLPYPDGAASLLLIQTVNSLAQVPLVVVAVGLVLRQGILPPSLEIVVVIACVLLVLFMGLVLAALRLRWLFRLVDWLERRWASARLKGFLDAFREVETQLAVFVRERPARFAVSLCFSFGNWLAGAVELFLILSFLDRPISFADAWMIEGVVVLVRSATFFLPGHIGAQDGAITGMVRLVAGSAELGLAVALIRRARELSWSFLGLAIGGWYGVQGRAAAASAGSVPPERAGLQG